MKNRLQKESLVSLIVGLVLAAIVVPWSLSTIKKSNELLRNQQEQLAHEATSVPSGQQGAYANQQNAYDQAAQRERDGQTARLKAELDNLAIPRPVPAPPAPRAAYSIVPAGTPELAPLEGWVDQPNANRPGRVHTNLRWRWSEHAASKPVKTGRAVCLKTRRLPAERIHLTYGWVSLPARTVQIACSSGGPT